MAVDSAPLTSTGRPSVVFAVAFGPFAVAFGAAALVLGAFPSDVVVAVVVGLARRCLFAVGFVPSFSRIPDLLLDLVITPVGSGVFAFATSLSTSVASASLVTWLAADVTVGPLGFACVALVFLDDGLDGGRF